MIQGEFVEKVLAEALSEPDIKHYVNSQSKEDLNGLLKFIYKKQGAIIAEGLFKDRNGFFNLRWREQFEKLHAVNELIKERLGGSEKSIPDVLDTDDFKCQLELAKVGGLISQDGEWIAGPVKLSVFAMMINKMPGAMKPHRYTPYWKPFEDYFGYKNLSQYFATSSFSGTEDNTDSYQKYLYDAK